MLHIVTWWWGQKYHPEYILKLATAIERQVSQEHNFIVMTDRPDVEMDLIPAYFDYQHINEEDLHLTKIKGCFARLRMFDPNWQYLIDAEPGDRIVNIDLDFVITGNLDSLFDRPEPFVILQGANTANPCPYNGALFMIRAGEFPEVWNDFSLENASKIPFYEFSDDQGWLWHKLPDAPAWPVGPKSGIYVYKKNQWPEGDALPAGARAVTFIGKKNPKDLQHLPWVRDNWRM